MKTMKKVVEACEPEVLTNMVAINHLLAQVEWWHWIVALVAIYGLTMLFWRSAREHGRALGILDGSGLLRGILVNGRYQVTEIPKNTLIRALLDIDTGTSHYYAIDTEMIHGGAERARAAQTFQVVETHGGDLIQLAELEVVPEPETPPKRRHRFAAWVREKTSRPIVLTEKANPS